MTDGTDDELRKEDARFADEVFARLEPVEPSPQLNRRVAQIPIEHPKGAVWPFRSVWHTVVAAAAAALLGVAAGTWSLEATESSSRSLASSADTLGNENVSAEVAHDTAATPPGGSTVGDDYIEDADLDALFSLALASGWDDGSLYGATITSTANTESL